MNNIKKIWIKRHKSLIQELRNKKLDKVNKPTLVGNGIKGLLKPSQQVDVTEYKVY